MDRKLVAWARAVKARQRRRATDCGVTCPGATRPGPDLPPLWLFTDSQRLPDPCPVAARLPPGLAGVVFRPAGPAAARRALGRRLARICRARRLQLVVAGDAGLAAALGAGIHLRGGRRRGPIGGVPQLRCGALVTSSAHSVAELVQARRAGVAAAFLSPVFPTASHPGARTLGVSRWAAMARCSGLPALALGGVSGSTIRRLPQLCRGVGAIGALG